MSVVKAIIYTVVILILVAFFWWLAGRSIKSAVYGGDAQENITIAYNLCHKLIYSGLADGTPTGYRQPGFPTYLAIAIAANPMLRNVSLDQLLANETLIIELKRAQIPLLPLTAVLAMYLAWLLTKDRLLSLIAMLLVGFSGVLHWAIGLLLTELLSSLLVLCFSISLCLLVRKRSYRRFVVTGFILSLLILTNAIFFYAIGLAAVVMVWVVLRSQTSRKAVIAGALLFILTSSALPLAWMTRNYYHCGRFAISGRGGIVLLTRANYNMMNATEYLGSFLWWTPGHYVPGMLLQKIFGENATAPGGSLANLNRENESGYFRSAYASQMEIARTTGLAGYSFEMDKRLKKLALEKIKAHPLRHLATILPFAYRGSFIEQGPMTPMALPYWLAVIYLLIRGIRLKKYDWLMLILPGIYLICIHSLITHNLPRYNSPAVPILAVALVTALQHIYQKIRIR